MPNQTILCLASYEKGQEFLRECKRQGCIVYLLTTKDLEHADWPRESIDEMFYIPDLYNRNDVVLGVSYMARTHVIDRIVPLDDYDLEMAATLREHLRVPGMGETTTRYFRDKLAMRVRARDRGILVPEFIQILNYDALRHFMTNVPGPWVLKPRSEASSIGLKKVHNAEELWQALETLGDRQSFYLLERFVPGEVYHVDSIVWDSKIVFAETHKYGQPPMSVMHEGGLFTSHTLPRGCAEEAEMKAINQKLVEALGLLRGVSHTEFIRGKEDGKFYFLETAARVGGANIVEVVEASTGLNLWAEWAKVEIAGDDDEYKLPAHRSDYAGVIISLASQEQPDTSAYHDSEIFWRLKKKSHVGFVLSSPSLERVKNLLDDYSRRIYADYFAKLPAPDKPTS